MFEIVKTNGGYEVEVAERGLVPQDEAIAVDAERFTSLGIVKFAVMFRKKRCGHLNYYPQQRYLKSQWQASIGIDHELVSSYGYGTTAVAAIQDALTAGLRDAKKSMEKCTSLCERMKKYKQLVEVSAQPVESAKH